MPKRMVPDPIVEEAATWYADLDLGMANVSEFEAWRDANPKHAVAFARILATVSLIDKVKDCTGSNPWLRPRDRQASASN